MYNQQICIFHQNSFRFTDNTDLDANMYNTETEGAGANILNTYFT